MKDWEQEIIDKFGSFVVKVNSDSQVYEIIGKEEYNGAYYWVLRNFETGSLISPCFRDNWIPLKQVETIIEEFVPSTEQATHWRRLSGDEAGKIGKRYDLDYNEYGNMKKVRKVTWEPI